MPATTRGERISQNFSNALTSGDTPTTLLITYAGTAGVPTSIPAKGENPEY